MTPSTATASRHTGGRPWLRRAAPHLALAAALLVGSLVVTWPLVLDLSHSVIDEGDPLLTSWILGWVSRAVFTQPLELFDAPVFYPEKKALAFSEALILPSLVAAPVIAAGGTPILANNIVYLLTFVLGGWFFYLMCRELQLGARASVLGAIMFGFASFRMDFSHLQLAQVQYLPLQVLFLNRYFRLRRSRDLAFSWLAVLATAVSCSYYGVYAVLLMALLHLVYLTASLRTISRRLVLTVLMAPLPTVAVLMAYYLPYSQVKEAYGFARTLGSLRAHSADLAEYLCYFSHNLLFPGLGKHLYARAELYLAPGLVAILLVVSSCLRARRLDDSAHPGESGAHHRVRAILRWLRHVALLATLAALGTALFSPRLASLGLLRAALLGFLAIWLAEILLQAYACCDAALWSMLAWIGLLALWLSTGTEMTVAGRDLGPGIYRFFFEWIPGFWGMRAVYRVSVLFFLCGFALAARAADQLERRGKLPSALYAALALLAVAERLNSPIPWIRYQTRDPEAYQWLAQRPGDGAVLELPLRVELGAYRVQYDSLRHGKPLMNGVSGFIPPAYYRRVKQLETYPGERALDLIEGMLPLEFILWHREDPRKLEGNRYDGLDRLPILRKEAEFGQTTIYRVRHTFDDGLPRDSMALFVDPAYGNLDSLEITLRSSDSRPLLVDVWKGGGKERTVQLQDQAGVVVSVRDIPRQGGWIEILPADVSQQPWALSSYEAISDVTAQDTCVWIGDVQFKPKYKNSVLVVASDGFGEPAVQRSYDVEHDALAARRLRGFLRDARARRYVFLVVSGTALANAGEPLLSSIGSIARGDPGRGAFAMARIVGDAPAGGRPQVETAAGDASAAVYRKPRTFVITQFRMRPRH